MITIDHADGADDDDADKDADDDDANDDGADADDDYNDYDDADDDIDVLWVTRPASVGVMHVLFRHIILFSFNHLMVMYFDDDNVIFRHIMLFFFIVSIDRHAADIF